MKRPTASDVVLKVLGLLLLTAAILKGHELLTVPVANRDLWSWRPFLIFQVEFELALGIWLLSGIFRRLAWLASLACFGLFCCVTLYKALTGAASCGCFGAVHVNPWITLLAIDLPAVVALSLFRPPSAFAPFLNLLRKQESIHSAARQFADLFAFSPRLIGTVGFIISVLSITTPILALGEPAAVTATYEVLEPRTWMGERLPILEDIDIADRLASDTWLLVLFHHDCPDCRRMIPQCRQTARQMAGRKDLPRVALIEVPPYGPSEASQGSCYAVGRLTDVKEWFVTTPVAALVRQGVVKAVWETTVPSYETIVSMGEGASQVMTDSVSPR